MAYETHPIERLQSEINTLKDRVEMLEQFIRKHIPNYDEGMPEIVREKYGLHNYFSKEVS